MSHRQNQTAIDHEAQFARRVAARLSEGLDHIDANQRERLAFARKLALRAQRTNKPSLAAFARPAFGFAGRSVSAPGGNQGSRRLGVSIGLMALVLACLFGIFEIEQQRRIEELADIDSALLSDELPISAYADHGFNAYVKQNP